ncbi:AAA domain-containing protein [Paraliomyxa miuraensis]|uniref:AAA domain-containing protein n=1 Tax=Paraliomyxa miuraensis TaxID=376150 RepID=UPI0022506911|nr:AAA domain-containing protein [Paraliomyxa miuraensis]MCX4242514.1 DEAD/DEAH box helicase family protein [Paraliomyxa miuraensis]
MKALFFHAAAGHPAVAHALMNQAEATLGPFQRYLRQAIHTAKERQVRYQLPWERVRNVVTLRLEPIDTVLRVTRRPPGMVLVPWPAEVTPDLSKPAFVIDRSLPVVVESARATSNGLLVHTTPALEPSDRLIWCGCTCTAEHEPAPPAPRTIADPDGRALTLRGSPEADADHAWRIVIEGRVEAKRLLVDGEEVEVLHGHPGPRKVIDERGRSLDASGLLVRTEDRPAEGLLRGDDGVRYRWSAEGGASRRGWWIRLLAPETVESDEVLDPRVAFCEGDVREVWTQPKHREDAVFKVLRVDADRHQLLLDRLPPEGSTLYLPVDVRNLYLQCRALYQLAQAPLPHHQGLLRPCEDPDHVRWPAVSPVALSSDGWRSLTDLTRDGTCEQRRFVEKALGSPDFAFLEGPPGSGKTTAICELVQQLVEGGQRVLLCASTHVAIDNVLERLLGGDCPIDAVRIGRLARVDDRVQQAQLDVRVDALVERWRRMPAMRQYDAELAAMAERSIIMTANLTCGTTMGIVNHPLFRGRDEDLQRWERPITTMPHWDVLIVDEASKTLIQEFMVPALMAKRWIIVGDVRQLPPFSDRADLVANLRDLVDPKDRPLFPRDHQRACLLLFHMLRGRVRQPGMRWLVVEAPGVLDAIERELEVEPEDDLLVARVVPRARARGGPVEHIAVEQLRSGDPEALHLAAATWVLVSDDLLPEVSGLLPSNLLLTRELASDSGGLDEGNALLLRQGHWLPRAGRLPTPYRGERSRGEVTTFADCQRSESEWLARHDLANEVAWRLTRIHELRHGRDQRERKRLREDLGRLMPRAVDIFEPLAEIEDIGLPSILEVLQEGIGEDRSHRPSALTCGLRADRPHDFEARFGSLRYQHRMHPEISSFAREIIYDGRALEDANTIAQRDAGIGWSFGELPARRVWWHVQGHEDQGINRDEVRVVEGLVRDFIAWARRVGPPQGRHLARWEVACLAFYVKQERALSSMLQQLTNDSRGSTRFDVDDAPVEIVCGTVDRFQGREADLVLLSIRNTRRIGFLDSPNRLNVAVTRARQQLVVVGNADYFGQCHIAELKELVHRSPRIPRMRNR